jgi:hypothetical protein
MELENLLRLLRDRWPAVALIVLASMTAGLLAAYRFDGFPSKPVPRHQPRGHADLQLLVDAPTPAVTETHNDIMTLISRTPFYAQVLRSREMKLRVAKVTGIPVDRITTEGPWTGVAAGQNNDVPAEARGLQIAGEKAPYRLSFVPRVRLPVITVHAEAPSRVDAAILAQGAAKALQGYNRELHAALEKEPKRPVVIRQVGVVATSESGGRTSQIQALLVTATGVLAGLLALVSATEMRRRLRPVPTSRPADLPELIA